MPDQPAKPEWFLAYALPDLPLGQTIETKWTALVPFYDPRLLELKERYPRVKQYMDSFVNHKGEQSGRSALLVKTEAPFEFRLGTTLRDLRNVITAASLLYTEGKAFGVQYSDSFNFFPIRPPHQEGTSFIGVGSDNRLDPIGAGLPKQFVLTTNPALPWLGPHSSISYDRKILRLLIYQWERNYKPNPRTDKIRTLKSRFSIVLFRSMQMVFRASSMPFENAMTAEDYGTKIALWVSAMEILSHYRFGHGSEQNIRGELESFPWMDKLIRHKMYSIKVKIKGKKVSVRTNLAGKILNRIYVARNDYLHGNFKPIRRMTALAHPKSKGGLLEAAPILYRALLLSYLEKNMPARTLKAIYKGLPIEHPDQFGLMNQFFEYNIEWSYSNRLLRLIGKMRR